MYAKCGSFNKAIDAFNNYINNDTANKIDENNISIYGAIMDCYAKIGDFKNVFKLYDCGQHHMMMMQFM